MAVVPYLVAYIAILAFSLAVIARIVMWSKMPMHVRWELYPVAHEPGRAHYGGSYLEDADWWKKPREKSMVGELKVMVPEILFLVALFENNRKLWLRSFPFHFGLYLVIAATVAMFGGSILAAIAPDLMAGGLGTLVQYLVIACGAIGLVLGIVGALGLLQRRLFDPDLKDFTAPADIFNLLFFIAAFGLALVTFFMVDRDFGRVMSFVYGLVTFNMAQLAGTGSEVLLPALSAIMLGVLVAYIPLTHMSHFVGKYFAYHSIRWADEPNTPGSHLEAPIKEVLALKVDWAAPHIQGGGKKSWADVATEDQK